MGARLVAPVADIGHAGDHRAVHRIDRHRVTLTLVHPASSSTAASSEEAGRSCALHGTEDTIPDPRIWNSEFGIRNSHPPAHFVIRKASSSRRDRPERRRNVLALSCGRGFPTGTDRSIRSSDKPRGGRQMGVARSDLPSLRRLVFNFDMLIPEAHVPRLNSVEAPRLACGERPGSWMGGLAFQRSTVSAILITRYGSPVRLRSSARA